MALQLFFALLSELRPSSLLLLELLLEIVPGDARGAGIEEVVEVIELQLASQEPRRIQAAHLTQIATSVSSDPRAGWPLR